MRARIFLLGGSIGLVAAAFVVQACGETESTPAAADSGADVALADTGAKEAAPPAEQDAATCDLSADFTTKIPDASIADGASTTGLCIQCGNAKCGAQIDDCNTNCSCQGIAAEALDCYLKNPTNPLVACAGSFTALDQETQDIGIALIACINGKCKKECATDSFADAGTDAGDGG